MPPESINDALIEAVKVLGGSKVVGCLLWPEKTPEQAQRALLDCLNPDRPAHLTPEQMMLVMRQCRNRGCHVVMAHLAASLGYAEPAPIDPKDEADELRRQLLEMGRELQAKLARLEGLERPQLKAAA